MTYENSWSEIATGKLYQLMCFADHDWEGQFTWQRSPGVHLSFVLRE